MLSQSIPVMAADQVHTSYLSAKGIEITEQKWKREVGGERLECLIIELCLSQPQRFKYHFDFKHVFKPTKLTGFNPFM